MDEVTLMLHPVLRKAWMKRGRQMAIPAAGQQQHAHFFGAYNWATDEVIWLDAPKKNTQTFTAFLEHFMQRVQGDKPIVLVMDNASYHHSAAAEAALAFFEDDGLISCWLPPYCSELNPIERFWRHLKDFACANKLFASVLDLVASAVNCLLAQNDFNNSERFLFLKT